MFDRKEKKYRKGIHSTLARASEGLEGAGLIARLQSFPNGQESAKESTRQVSRRL